MRKESKFVFLHFFQLTKAEIKMNPVHKKGLKKIICLCENFSSCTRNKNKEMISGVCLETRITNISCKLFLIIVTPRHWRLHAGCKKLVTKYEWRYHRTCHYKTSLKYIWDSGVRGNTVAHLTKPESSLDKTPQPADPKHLSKTFILH